MPCIERYAGRLAAFFAGLAGARELAVAWPGSGPQTAEPQLARRALARLG
mgnify:CR=1 FL=1